MESKKKESDRNKVKRKVVTRTIEVKKTIISKHEAGVRISVLAKEYGMAKSSICTILKNKEAIKRADVAKGVKVLTKQRSREIEEMEKLLLIWINNKELAGEHVSEPIICEKARQLHDELLARNSGTSVHPDVFKASKGWFDKFKKRSGIRSAVRHAELQDMNRECANKFAQEFSDYVKAEGFVPQQVFNCDETGLFWKRMPRRTYITQEEKALPGHKPMKDRLTLLLCANASGDLKVKPLLVYHSENPRAFKNNHVIKSKLSVMWRANSKAWVTRQFFIEWIHEVFAPSVRTYLQEQNLPVKCLLVMDVAPAHPPSLEDELVEEFGFITVKFLPSNLTPLVQPMDQHVISNFKKLYTRALFQKCFEVTSDTELTLREFWKQQFNILHCINILDKAWMQVTRRTVNSAWRKLWPDCADDRDEEEDHKVESVAIINDIVSLGKSMGLLMNIADVEELVKEHQHELTTEELELLQKEQQMTVVEEMYLGPEEGREDLPSSLINDMCAKWAEVQSFVEHYHPDKTVTGRIISLFNDNAMSHFRNMIKRRQTKIKLIEQVFSGTEAL